MGIPLGPEPEELGALIGELGVGLTIGLVEYLDRAFPAPRARKYREVPLATYADVLRYFSRERPEHFDIAGGALFRRRDAGGVVLYQLFLDSQDHMVTDGQGKPFGRAFRALQIDDALAQKFGSKDLIIFR